MANLCRNVCRLITPNIFSVRVAEKFLDVLRGWFIGMTRLFTLHFPRKIHGRICACRLGKQNAGRNILHAGEDGRRNGDVTNIGRGWRSAQDNWMVRKPHCCLGGYVYHVLNRSAGRIALFRRDEGCAASNSMLPHQAV